MTLRHDITGAGEPVLFIHGALIADAFRPLVAEATLAGQYRLITYHRRGYNVGEAPAAQLSIAVHATDCRELLADLGISRAHVVGHSFGGLIALQLAIDSPTFVATLVLLEPALVLGESGPGYRAAIAEAQRRFAAGDAEGAVDDFLRRRFGADYRVQLDGVVPGAFEQAVANAKVSLDIEMPAAADFHFGPAEARRITQPALVVLGANSNALWPRFGETHRALLDWLPRAEPYVLPNATHAMQLQNPHSLAVRLVEFFMQHPL